MMVKSRRWGKARTLLSLALFFVLWEIIARVEIVPRYIFPSFTDVFASAVSLTLNGVLLHNYFLTLLRALVGFSLGTLCGLSVGVLVVVAGSLADFVQPIATLLFSIPAVGWIPLLIVWVGIREMRLPIAVSFMCSFPPVLYGVISGFRTMSRDEVEAALCLGARPQQVLRRIVLPQLLLRLIPILKSEAVMVWKSVFVTEMVALSSGLGYLALMYSSSIEISNLIAVILVLGLTTLVIIQLFDLIETKVSARWVAGESERRGTVVRA